MKKVIAVLAVVLLCSGAAFASQAELLGLGGLNVQFTTLEETALVNPALLGNFVNLAVIGISIPTPAFLYDTTPEATGLVILGAGPGILAIGVGPRAFGGIDLLNVGVSNATNWDIPNSTVNLGYALDLKGAKVGLSVGYGVNNEWDKATWVGDAEITDPTETIYNNSALKVILGAALDVGMPLDVALSLSMNSAIDETKDYNDAKKLIEESGDKIGDMDIALNAKTTVSEMILALNVTLNTLSYQGFDWVDAAGDGTADTNDIETYSDSSLAVSLLAGKVIKATDNLTVTLSSGVQLATAGAYTDIVEETVAKTKTLNNNTDVSSGMNIDIPFNLAVNVNLGKLLTISNDSLSGSIGISKKVIVVHNYNTKVENLPTDETIDHLTEHSDVSNNNPVTGSVGIGWKLGDLKVNVSGGADFDVPGMPIVAGAAFTYDWK